MGIIDLALQYPVLAVGVGLLVIAIILMLLNGLIDIAIYAAGIGALFFLLAGVIIYVTNLNIISIPTVPLEYVKIVIT